MNLEERVANMEDRLNQLERSNTYTFEKKIQILDGRHITLGQGTGTKIGTSALQKIGFYNATPVVQAGVVSPANSAAATYSQTDAGTWVGAINGMRTALRNLGLMA